MVEIENHLGLVRLCANRFTGKGIEYDDLYGAGCIGLVKAAKSFEEERGLKFSTYAVPVILGEIKRLFRDGGSIKVSRSIKELSLKINRERENFIKQYSREPSISELAEIFGTEPFDIIEAINLSCAPMSLTVETDDGEDELDIAVESPEEKLLSHITLKQVIGELNANDRKLIYLRYFEDKTQTETAKLLGTSQVNISRREKKLLAILKEKITA
ncbi:MAG: sigma-70 family RNA polymerase sigma factor [Ruminococcus sp.]|jgi:RNA polymerase sporulation-specific sigma factor|nr:sigma-70 family RNA polymerase sigma factor [Ruminococcus sp.]